MSQSMKKWMTIITVSCALGTVGASAVAAQKERAVEQFSCKDVMKENGANKNSAIAFLHGFILGKSGSSKFHLEALTKQTDAFIDGCLDQPAAKELDVMMKVKS